MTRATRTIAVATAALLSIVGLAGITRPALANGQPGCGSASPSQGFHEHLVDSSIAPLGDIPADVETVPTWNGSFTTAGQTYPFTMVGSDPAAGSATTSVPVLLVPLQLDFANGCVIGNADMVRDITASPLFTATPLGHAGTTQYVDAFQRDNFWSTVSTTSPDYHLLLAPTVAPVQTLHVPTAQGLTAMNPYTNRVEAMVGGKWINTALLGLLKSLHVSPGTLALFVSYNTFATDQNPNDCLSPAGCGYFTGYHDAVFSDHNPHAINTYALASFEDHGDAVPQPYDEHLFVLSHELLEWADDPFAHGARLKGQPTFFGNATPTWKSPDYYGGAACGSVLEVADPLEGSGTVFGAPVLAATPPASPSTYLLADGAFLSWFSRQTPSSAIGGRYDLGGVFSGPSDPC